MTDPADPPKTRTRDAGATKARILAAAKREFAKHGLAGARVDSRRFVAMVNAILVRGVEAGVICPGVVPIQLNITIAAIGYYYLTNRFTGSILFEKDMMTKEALDERLRFNIDTILRLVGA